MDFDQTTILLELKRFGISLVIDVLNRGSRLRIILLVEHAHTLTTTGASLVTGLLKEGRLRQFLFFLGIFSVAASIASLGPSVHHLHFLDASAHQAVIRVLIRAIHRQKRIDSFRVMMGFENALTRFA